MKIRETISRDLADEPQSVVKVYETSRLRDDFNEYVLTDTLAKEFAKVLGPIVDSAKPATSGASKVGIWASGFFGSGKSHFSKIAGHLAADTPIGDETARSLFRKQLRAGNPPDDRLAELLQEATNYQLRATLVPFDIATVFAPTEVGVGGPFLRMLYETVGLSSVIPFAEREIELQKVGLHEEFKELYLRRSGSSWDEEKGLASSVSLLAECLAELLPDRYSSPQFAVEALRFELDVVSGMSIKDLVIRLVRWLDTRQAERREPQRLLFVVDEVGAWARRNLDRIEQMRALIEELAVVAQGRIWLMVTSQEKLSDVVANAPLQDPAAARNLQHRLEARFTLNVHLESSEVGTVIEKRLLEKRPASRPALQNLWNEHEPLLADIAGAPGIELGGNYPGPSLERFIKDYPFLPYQIPAAADLFGGMRGPKVSSGARSMIEVVFDAVRKLADLELGRIVSWDQIFDATNRGNEFADEQYLGGQGLHYLMSSDQHVLGTPILPSRILKVLWLVQQSPRIPRTLGNVARLMIDRLDADLVQVQRDVEETLAALEKANFVRMETATGHWRFLSQDQVTVERIVRRIAQEDVRVKDLRDHVFSLYSERLLSQFNGRVTHGKSKTAFDHAVFFGDTPLRNEDAPVQLRLILAGTPQAEAAEQVSAADLDAPVVYWVVEVPVKLEERLRRALAIERLDTDEEFRRVATQRTKSEAEGLRLEADDLRTAAAADVVRALEQGVVHWGGQTVHVNGEPGGGKRTSISTSARAEVERALHDRIEAKYTRFHEGDLAFNPNNIEKLFQVAAPERGALDPNVGFFDAAGHVLTDHPVLEAIGKDLAKATKDSGKDLIDRFRRAPFGWPGDLVRYGLAALFVEGRVSARDSSGRRFEDPRVREARMLFGTAAFKSTRLEVEENPLTAQERSAARSLLGALGTQPTGDDEVSLKEATLGSIDDLRRKLVVVGKAQEVGLPLPEIYETIEPILDALRAEPSRTKLVRALIGHAAQLREGKTALDRLEVFTRHNGPTQYRRSQELLGAALQAGLAEDPVWGQAITDVEDQYKALTHQRRVLDEWDGVMKDYRAKVVEAYRAAYLPLREEVAKGIRTAREAITSMPEFQKLGVGDRAQIKAEFLGDGRPLAEVAVPKLHDEEQLLAATRTLNIPHMRATLVGLEPHVAQAKARVLNLYAALQAAEGEAFRPIAIWDPIPAFSGAQFSHDDDVDMVFDGAKEEVKALLRTGKVVRVL